MATKWVTVTLITLALPLNKLQVCLQKNLKMITIWREKAMKFRIHKLSLKTRLMSLIPVIVLPLTCMVLDILIIIQNYTNSYDSIMKNLKIANEYNINFKE